MGTSGPRSVVILGAGSIGIAFAATFADARFDVTLVEPDQTRRDGAGQEFEKNLRAIELAGLSQGGTGVTNVVDSLDAASTSAEIVIECGPEDLAVKQTIFRDLLARMDAATVLVTASSAIPMSQVLPDAKSQARCLVAHPVNPPSILRLVELAPAPHTTATATAKASAIFEAAGFESVMLGHEVEGFVVNRLQSAVLREAYRLVDEGVADVAGIDAAMRLGLGPRWSLSGPFETAELNTPGGIEAHARRMGPAYKRIGEARGETVDWNADLVASVTAQRAQILPPDQQPDRRAWRARAVARLVAERDRILSGDDG